MRSRLRKPLTLFAVVLSPLLAVAWFWAIMQTWIAQEGPQSKTFHEPLRRSADSQVPVSRGLPEATLPRDGPSADVEKYEKDLQKWITQKIGEESYQRPLPRNLGDPIDLQPQASPNDAQP